LRTSNLTHKGDLPQGNWALLSYQTGHRSLRRKLEHEGTTFKNLLDKERELCALQLLENSGMKLDELALHLGYTDAASFSRAFRRWRGSHPGSPRNDRKLSRNDLYRQHRPAKLFAQNR